MSITISKISSLSRRGYVSRSVETGSIGNIRAHGTGNAPHGDSESVASLVMGTEIVGHRGCRGQARQRSSRRRRQRRLDTCVEARAIALPLTVHAAGGTADRVVRESHSWVGLDGAAEPRANPQPPPPRRSMPLSMHAKAVPPILR